MVATIMTLLGLQVLYGCRVYVLLYCFLCVAAPLWFVARPCQTGETQRLGA